MQRRKWPRWQSILVWSGLVLSCQGLPVVAGQVSVSSVAALTKAAAQAQPGDVIQLADGRYDEECRLVAKGTSAKPVVVRSETIGGANLCRRLKISGDFVSLVGFRFTGNGSVFMKGSGLRMSRCSMSNVQAGRWVQVDVASRNIEIDHCLFEKKETNRKRKSGCQLIQIVVRNKQEKHHLHHNHFRDIPKGAGNGFETVQLITRGNPFDPPPGHSGTVIEDNLFERCNGEAEIISVKSNGNLIRGNTFRACRGSLVFRHGDGNVATGNIFLGDGESGSGGIRLQGTDQVVANNYFHRLGRAGVAMMDGTPDQLYVRVERASILHNTFVNCRYALEVGLSHPKHPSGTVPRQCVVAGNLFFLGGTKPPATGQAIRLVKDDQPEAWQWVGNTVYGKLGIPPVDGVRSQEPNLRFQENGLALPTARTPVTEHAMDVAGVLGKDLLGATRDKRMTVGAIDFREKPAGIEPLTDKLVGPQATEAADR